MIIDSLLIQYVVLTIPSLFVDEWPTFTQLLILLIAGFLTMVGKISSGYIAAYGKVGPASAVINSYPVWTIVLAATFQGQHIGGTEAAAVAFALLSIGFIYKGKSSS